MAKNFRTIEELIRILESRGVKTDRESAAAIERESYYAIVNGYKGPFLNKRAMAYASDDVYLHGTRFQWMYDLFLFDRDLRFVTFRYLTRAEAIMRTAVAYAFCHNHTKIDAYLDRSNFCTWNDYLVPRSYRGNKRSLHSNNLNDLMTRLNGKLVDRPHTRDFIKHYLRVHGAVPLWVLANDLTFGNIIHFYQLMQVKDRREACKIIAQVSRRNVASLGHLTERELLRAATVMNYFRNLCAHDERLYCAKMGNDGFSTMTYLMHTILPEEEVFEFVSDIVELFKIYRDRLHGVNPADLLADMGFAIDVPRHSYPSNAMPPKPGRRQSAKRALDRHKALHRRVWKRA